MAKQQIRLTESELQNLIAEAVKQELNEGAFDFLRGVGRKIKGDANTLATNAMTNARNMGTKIGKNIVQGYNKVAKPIQDYAKDVHNAGAYASEQAEREKMIQKNIAQRQQTVQKNISDAQNAIKLLTDLTQREVLKNGSSKMAIYTLKKYINGHSNY